MLGKIHAELKRLHDIVVWNYNMLEKEDADLRAKLEEVERDRLELKTRIDRLEAEAYLRQLKF